MLGSSGRPLWTCIAVTQLIVVYLHTDTGNTFVNYWFLVYVISVKEKKFYGN